MKKIGKVMILILLLNIIITGCSSEDKYEKFGDTFWDSFDTVTQVVGYAKTEEEFKDYMEIIHDRFLELHKYYDKYNSYEGMNNIKTINDNAGVAPVKVDKEIIDLLKFSLDWYDKTSGKTDITIGPVIDLWNDCRENAELNPEDAVTPEFEKLEEASKLMNINDIVIDEEKSTVYLRKKGMSLDVGSVAKGYATELVAREIEEKGLKSVLISAGGNIRGVGKPLDNVREKWGVGIQNPDVNLFGDSNLLDTVYINDMSVVTSGDYQRYYFVDGKRMHHIIDPDTLYPGDHYRAVTVVVKDSGLADYLSTTLYLLPYDESSKLVESLDGVEAMWVFPDGEIRSTEGMKKIMYSHGATGGK